MANQNCHLVAGQKKLKGLKRQTLDIVGTLAEKELIHLVRTI